MTELEILMDITIAEIKEFETEIDSENARIAEQKFCTDDDYEYMDGLHRRLDYLNNDVLIPLLNEIEETEEINGGEQ